MEKSLWSIALPGFSQLLNGKHIKGIVLISLEILMNVQANFNQAIILSFQGDISKYVQVTDYQWLMFFPCLYFFAMWDAWKVDGHRMSHGDRSRGSFEMTAYSLPF